MATTYISVAFNDQRIMDIDALKKHDSATNISRGLYVKRLLLEKIDEKLKLLKTEG